MPPQTLKLRDLAISPAMVLAPMAGVTHCAFRRLVSDFGGHGALFTEMIAARGLLGEDPRVSPYSRRRPGEGSVIYQLLVSPEDDVEKAIARLLPLEPAALDVNLGCPAPTVLKSGGGAALFRDLPSQRAVLERVRAAWRGPLTVKVRLGDGKPGWEERLLERLRIFSDVGVDAMTVHPRFFGDKLKRRARWELLPWVCGEARMPVVANGDLLSPRLLVERAEYFRGVAGIMLGRIVAARPWAFREFGGERVTVDHAEVWDRFFRYVNEDFPPTKAIGRVKEFTAYYARNFSFGHQLFVAVQSATSLAAARDRALAFLQRPQQLVTVPTFEGV